MQTDHKIILKSNLKATNTFHQKKKAIIIPRYFHVLRKGLDKLSGFCYSFNFSFIKARYKLGKS